MFSTQNRFCFIHKNTMLIIIFEAAKKKNLHQTKSNLFQNKKNLSLFRDKYQGNENNIRNYISQANIFFVRDFQLYKSISENGVLKQYSNYPKCGNCFQKVDFLLKSFEFMHKFRQTKPLLSAQALVFFKVNLIGRLK